MPIFDYQCQACSHSFDVLQKMNAAPLEDCPECGKPELRKMLSAPSFHLKGKGWQKSDDGPPKKPDVRPKYAHTFDSPVPHAEHDHAKPHSHDDKKKEAKQKPHDHGKAGKSHDHGHSHSHGHGHKH
jgi:putative FmdB family regulatory protein